MAFKEWFRRLEPMQLYLVLFLTCSFFIVELIASHITHALTLLVNAYHMLCNIIALIGCIASIKYSNRESKYNCNEDVNNSANICRQESSAIDVSSSTEEKLASEPSLAVKIKQSQSDRRMKNTFGWARINILTMLVCCVFLGSLCFSIQVESLQALAHINHMDGQNDTDEISYPMVVLCMGIGGIFVNVFCYILIGGYTFYHGSSIHVNKKGEVIIGRRVAINDEERRSPSSKKDVQNGSLRQPGRQGIREMFRDILGCVFAIVLSVLVRYTDPDVGKFFDPVFAIVSSISLFLLSYPYMKESGLILLQTIPNHININSLQKELLEAFPGIVNVHDLHVWQLTGEKIISTAHIMFLDQTVYASIGDQVTEFFIEMGITQVTIQPEFKKIKAEITNNMKDCMIRCQVENCIQSRCCSEDESVLESVIGIEKFISKSDEVISEKFDVKEIIKSSSPVTINVKSFISQEEDGSSPSSIIRNNLIKGNNVDQNNDTLIVLNLDDDNITTTKNDNN